MALATSLATLETSGLVCLAQNELELEYLFRHALIQDAAYGSLLKADRRVLHHAVGEILQRLYADQLEEIAPVLARHFAEAGDDERALKYFTLAGEVAARVFANAEAVLHYAQALEIAKRLPGGHASVEGRESMLMESRAGILRSLCLRLGRVLELQGQYDEAVVHYTAMEALGRERDERPLELAALMEHTKLRAVPSAKYDPAQGRVLAERTLALARELSDHAAEARVLWILLILNIYSGTDLHKAIPYGEQSATIARALNLRELLAFVLNDIWYPYVGTGQLPRAWSALEEAGRLWRELGNTPMLAANVSYLSNMHVWVGEPEQAVTRGEEAFRLAGSVGNIEGQATSRFVIGLAYADLGQFDRAVSIAEEGIALAEAFGLLAILSGTRAELGWLYGQLGAVEQGLGLARQASRVAEEKIPPLLGWTRSIVARLHLLRGETTGALAALAGVQPYRDIRRVFGFIPPYWIGAALAEGELALARNDWTHALALADDLHADLLSFGIRLLHPDILYLKARVLLAQGRMDDAAAVLREARASAQAIGSLRVAWSILAALSEIEAKRGHVVEAETLRTQAQTVVAYIADHCPSKLRETFLTLPNVRRVIRNA